MRGYIEFTNAVVVCISVLSRHNSWIVHTDSAFFLRYEAELPVLEDCKGPSTLMGNDVNRPTSSIHCGLIGSSKLCVCHLSYVVWKGWDYICFQNLSLLCKEMLNRRSYIGAC